MSDIAEIAEIQQHLEAARLYLRDHADEYGNAKQVKEFSSDRRKQCLARFKRPFIAGGDSDAMADTKARALDEYALELDRLAEQHRAAERAIATYDAADVSFKAAQSLLSFSKSMKEFV